MESRVDKAVEIFVRGFSCSQAIVATYGPLVGIPEHEGLKISAGFGAGMGRMQGVCGALTGAFMIAGCKFGMIHPDDKESKETTYAVVQHMAERFRETHGATTCKDLLECDLKTIEGNQEYKAAGKKDNVCIPCVQTAARLVETVVLAKGKERNAQTIP